ncbi:MAG: VWA domain-containing protein [Clostridia bacterium]|nr:VWA domain-containing protein [Clostridia bacterium]
MQKTSTTKKVLIFAGIAILVFAAVFIGINLTRNVGMTEDEITKEDAGKQMTKLLDGISVIHVDARRAAISDDDILSDEEELPDISSYPFTVTGSGDINIEIFSSPEKAGEGTDGWLNEVAERFNAENITVNGKTASVSIRSVSSGLAVDYIKSGKYVPDALTPSNEFWGKMLEAGGVDLELKQEKIVGNVAGILLSKSKYNEILEKYGSVSMKVISECTANNELAMGYTNPFASSTGMNFLVSTLYSYDADDLLSEKAVAGFKKFQENVPLVSYNTIQMRKSAESGSLDAFVLEYQSYINDATLKNDYIFTPFGARHDNPMYAIDKLSSDKNEVLDKFCEYCLNESSQQLAEQYGFNQNKKYKSELPDDISGDKLLSAQKLYKANKDSGKPIIAVFVADTSGSMRGESINALQTSLINSMQYINKENYIGLVSYNSKVYINLPIAKFDLNQQSLFKGAVQDLDANGQTATYDAILVALDMVNKAMEEHPDAKPMIFLLSDGEQNTGWSLNDISTILGTYEVPIYSIGYNANIEALKRISEINEAATINADSDDIIYQLKNLFNSEM